MKEVIEIFPTPTLTVEDRPADPAIPRQRARRVGRSRSGHAEENDASARANLEFLPASVSAGRLERVHGRHQAVAAGSWRGRSGRFRVSRWLNDNQP